MRGSNSNSSGNDSGYDNNIWDDNTSSIEEEFNEYDEYSVP